jgi:aromatic amino acid aminotransferase I / 2-aminoadipate transaminase
MAPFAETHGAIGQDLTCPAKSPPPPPKTKRLAKNWSGYLTEESAARRPSALKAAFKHLTTPGLISLGGGLPLAAYFPILEVNVTVPSIGKWSETETAIEGTNMNIVKYANNTSSISNGVCRRDGQCSRTKEAPLHHDSPVVGLSSTLQYGLGTGDPHLVSFLKAHTQMVHNPPYEDWSTTLTCGNTYSFYTCLRMLLERGDYIIMEEYTYSSAISTCGPMGIKIVGIDMDDQGMLPASLDTTLSHWDVSVRGARKPRVIYLVPYSITQNLSNHRTGQNPTGASMFLQRRKDIYKICQKHDIIILEDEPYYFLQMEQYGAPVSPNCNTDLLSNLIPSFMSMDADGRVLRLDSLSKVSQSTLHSESRP